MSAAASMWTSSQSPPSSRVASPWDGEEDDRFAFAVTARQRSVFGEPTFKAVVRFGPGQWPSRHRRQTLANFHWGDKEMSWEPEHQLSVRMVGLMSDGACSPMISIVYKNPYDNDKALAIKVRVALAKAVEDDEGRFWLQSVRSCVERSGVLASTEDLSGFTGWAKSEDDWIDGAAIIVAIKMIYINDVCEVGVRKFFGDSRWPQQQKRGKGTGGSESSSEDSSSLGLHRVRGRPFQGKETRNPRQRKLEAMFNERHEKADFAFLVGDRRFPVDERVASLSSAVIEADVKWCEGQSKTFPLTDFLKSLNFEWDKNYEAVTEVVRFMYTGKCHLDQGIDLIVLLLADFLAMSDLFEEAASAIANALTKERALLVLSVANAVSEHGHSDEGRDLYKCALDFVMWGLSEILEQGEAFLTPKLVDVVKRACAHDPEATMNIRLHVKEN